MSVCSNMNMNKLAYTAWLQKINLHSHLPLRDGWLIMQDRGCFQAFLFQDLFILLKLIEDKKTFVSVGIYITQENRSTYVISYQENDIITCHVASEKLHYTLERKRE